MQLQLVTRTPLWTGDVDNKSTTLQPTGIIGSLRWWYEVIVRGLGGWACDPTKQTCTYDSTKGLSSICDVCRLFGTTGWARRFRLTLEGENSLNADEKILIPSGRVHNNRAGGWYFYNNASSNISCNIVLLTTVDINDKIRMVIALISRHAATGAKVAQGYGVFDAQEKEQPLLVGSKISANLSFTRPPRSNLDLPELREFFFTKLTFSSPTAPKWWRQIPGINDALKGFVLDENGNRYNLQGNIRKSNVNLETAYDNGLIPVAPAIRNWLRFTWFRANFPQSKRLEDFIFGRTATNDNIASKINVSYAYKNKQDQWEIRIWGWLPEKQLKSQYNLARQDFLNKLREALEDASTWQKLIPGANVKLTAWPTNWATKQDDGLAYLKELLGVTANE